MAKHGANFSISQLIALVTCVAVGMVAFPAILNLANVATLGRSIPDHMTTILIVTGGVLGAVLYLQQRLIIPFFTRSGSIGENPCGKCGRMNAVTTKVCPRCENHVDS